MRGKEPIIKKEEYFARLAQGVPIGDCWVDFGNGELAYALQEIVMVGVPINKCNVRFFETYAVHVCMADNTRVDTRQLDVKISKVEKAMEDDRKKRAMKNELISIVNNYFALKIRTEKFGAKYDERIKKWTDSRKRSIELISNDEEPLSIPILNFPHDLYYPNMRLINEFIRIRSLAVKEIKPPYQGEIRAAPTGYAIFARGIATDYLAPLAQQPIIKAMSVGGLVAMGAVGVEALHATGAFSIESSLSAITIKGGASVIGQAIVGDGVNKINVLGVASDAFLCPGVGAIVGSAVEWTPFRQKQPFFRMVGYNKSFGEFGTQAATSYGFGKAGSIGYYKFSSYLETQGERMFYDIVYNTWLQIIAKTATNRLTEEYEDPEKQNNQDN